VFEGTVRGHQPMNPAGGGGVTMTETRNQAEEQRQAALRRVCSFLLTINEQAQAEPGGYTVTTWGHGGKRES